MIYYTFDVKSNHWPRRLKKIDNAIQSILNYKKDLKFVKNKNYYCNFVLANDKFIKKLNKKFKKINKSTDVLTFVSKINLKNKKEERYCDIVFSIERISNDAKRNKTNFYNHLTHLIIHSFLHINDYVHHKIKDYTIMQELEINVLNRLGIKSPY
tara:strand:- start:117 stop:581 length:465 start_codon:yes stop_codon:yes gene_type:complete